MAAPRVSNDPDVQRNYAAQFALSAALVAALRRLWPVLDTRDVPGTLPRYKAGVSSLLDRYSSAAISLSADSFDAMRARAGVRDSFTTPITSPPPVEKVQASLGWATSPLLEPQITGGDATVHEPIPADTVTIVQHRVEAASTKVVADAGRNQMIESILADRKVRGWVRVARPDACAFCRMLATRPILATRGAFYRTEGTAGRNANARFTGEGDYKFHDNCHCTVAPVFADAYEAPAHTRADAVLYQEAQAKHPDTDALNAFRREVEAQRRTA